MDPEAYSGVTCASVFKSGEGSECEKSRSRGPVSWNKQQSPRTVRREMCTTAIVWMSLRVQEQNCMLQMPLIRPRPQLARCWSRRFPKRRVCSSHSSRRQALHFVCMRPHEGSVLFAHAPVAECFFEFDDRRRCSRCLVVGVCEKLAGQPGDTQRTRTQESPRKRPKSLGMPFRWDKGDPALLFCSRCGAHVQSVPRRLSLQCPMHCERQPAVRFRASLTDGTPWTLSVGDKDLRQFFAKDSVVSPRRPRWWLARSSRQFGGARRFTSVPFRLLITLLLRPWQTILMIPTRVPSLMGALSKMRESNGPTPCGSCGCAHLSWSCVRVQLRINRKEKVPDCWELHLTQRTVFKIFSGMNRTAGGCSLVTGWSNFIAHFTGRRKEEGSRKASASNRPGVVLFIALLFCCVVACVGGHTTTIRTWINERAKPTPQSPRR